MANGALESLQPGGTLALGCRFHPVLLNSPRAGAAREAQIGGDALMLLGDRLYPKP